MTLTMLARAESSVTVDGITGEVLKCFVPHSLSTPEPQKDLTSSLWMSKSVKRECGDGIDDHSHGDPLCGTCGTC